MPSEKGPQGPVRVGRADMSKLSAELLGKPLGLETEHPKSGVPVLEFHYNTDDQGVERRELGGKVRILDVVVDVLPLPDDPIARRYIPDWEQLSKEIVLGTKQVQLLRDLAFKMQAGVHTRVEGVPGASKTQSLEILAAITHHSYIDHYHSKDEQVGNIIGKFVPNTGTDSDVRYEELLALPNVPTEAKQIINDAASHQRPMTKIESMQVAKLLGFDGLDDKKAWKWKNGPLTGAMAYGAIYAAEERNLSPGSVIERQNSVIGKHPRLRIDEHEGELIRELSPEEQQIVEDGGAIPGIIGLNDQFWYVAAQNPYGIGGGRTEESTAARNRLSDVVVGALDETDYEEFLRFQITGDQPDVVYQGHRFSGEKDLPTAYRHLESMPNVDEVITFLAKFQAGLQIEVEKGTIGLTKDEEGGSYFWSYRNLSRFLDQLDAAQGSVLDLDELFGSGELVTSRNWRPIFEEALRQEYLLGMTVQDREKVIKTMIEPTGILDMLGQAHIPDMPANLKAMQAAGIKVVFDQKTGQWSIGVK